ncbi:MAG: Tyrosine-tRNA ligase [candidate division TM6 bacterium GW2011_GWE2_42_60]|nr:MAG: Tyrosine-tRNA ligase [candidate division TM6 bacterium GW2011_GWE2_42_60]HBY05710.1 tyrosine--tRNA ligase [Candidatus Dependentiae bacterium]
MKTLFSQELYAALMAGTEQVLPTGSLEKALASGKKLKIKFGMDPTAPDLHLGHAVVLSKLKLFQEMGHEVILLIGDFTTRIGDPTGRSKTRPPLSEEVIAQNAQTYIQQVGRVLDIEKITARYNSEWLDHLSSRDWVKLCAKVTLARIIERDDFAKRMAENQPIGFHELLYPLMQGYDSVVLEADVELGGSDQTFNLMMGRQLQELWGQQPQTIFTMPILEGLDGIQKMSKSLGNYVGLTEAPEQAFGKLMSISDDLMFRYYRLLLNKTEQEIEAFKQGIATAQIHPMELKKQLAYSILVRFWGQEDAEKGRLSFEQLFQKKDLSHAQEFAVLDGTPLTLGIVDLLKVLESVPSGSEARRLITSGAVVVDGEKVTDFKAQVTLIDGMQIKVGKHRFYKIKL